MTQRIKSTYYPTGVVPADFQSWINYIRKESAFTTSAIATDEHRKAGDRMKSAFDYLSNAVSKLRVVWAENYSQIKFDRS